MQPTLPQPDSSPLMIMAQLHAVIAPEATVAICMLITLLHDFAEGRIVALKRPEKYSGIAMRHGLGAAFFRACCLAPHLLIGAEDVQPACNTHVVATDSFSRAASARMQSVVTP